MIYGLGQPMAHQGAAVDVMSVENVKGRELRLESSMRVLVLGAGFGGLELTTRLSESSERIQTSY